MDLGTVGALAASLATSALLSMLLNALPAAVLSRGRDDPRVVSVMRLGRLRSVG